MRRADRLFQIVQALRGGRRTTAAALAEKLEVSRRTVYRDIADLQATGVPIDGEAGYGYVMQEGYDLPPLMFDTDEIVALVAGARLVQAWGGAAMARAAEEALAKIDAVLPEATRARARAVHVHSLGLGVAADLRDRIDRIERAVETRERLKLIYSDEAGQQTVRSVRPLGLWFWAPAWTLVGWCELRQDFRMFRLDRIVEMSDAGRFRLERGRKLEDFFAMMQAKGRC